jgi:hypothetical protein
MWVYDASHLTLLTPHTWHMLKVHSPHATMLADVTPVTTQPIYEALLSSGGVQILFPLLVQAPALSTDEATPAATAAPATPTAAAAGFAVGGAGDNVGDGGDGDGGGSAANPTQLTGALLSLLLTMMTSSTTVCRQIFEVKGFLMLGFLLEQVAADQLDQFVWSSSLSSSQPP